MASLRNSLCFQINAMANRAAGKGYENVENYDNVKFQFIGIENIHVMRQSLQKMLEGLCCFSRIRKNGLKVSIRAFLRYRWFRLLVTPTNPFLSACDSNEMSISTFLGILESSAWLKHVKAVLDTSVFISKVFDFKRFSSACIC